MNIQTEHVLPMDPKAIPSNGMSLEAMASRRVTIIEAMARLQARGWQMLEPISMPPAGNTRAAKAWTPEELKATREKRHSSGKRRAERKSVARTTPPRQAFTIPVGSWIAYTGKDNVQRVAQVLAKIPQFANPVPLLPEGIPVRQNPNPAPGKVNRYLLSLPGTASKLPQLRMSTAARIEDNLVQIFEAMPPEAMMGRLAQPLPKGANARWQDNKGFLRSGTIEAFVEADTPVSNLSKDWRPRADGEGAQEVSIRDRYLVRSVDGFLLPLAYVVERAHLARLATS